jgi:hypothetical protein
MTLFSVLVAAGSNWKGSALTCHFSATADGVPLAVVDDTKPAWVIPVAATTVTITATPTVPTYWPTTVTLSVGSTGALTPTGSTGSFVAIQNLGVAGVVQLSLATINLSRFKDVSDDVLALLGNPPATRQGKPAHVAQDYQKVYGDPWPPPDWGLDDRPDARFLDLPVPAHGVSFSKDPSVHVEAENVVLRLAGVVAPKLWGVSWPTSLDRNEKADPTPNLLFLRQGNAQYDRARGAGPDESFFDGDGLGPYPDNFDYASFGLYDDLAYVDGDLFDWPFSLGVPYQVAKAFASAVKLLGKDKAALSGVNAVTVHPVNSLKEDFGVIESTKQMGRILLELQSFMFRRAGVATPPVSLGKTAIASFSSGTHILARILASPDNLGETFLNDTVSAVYFLDPPWWAVKDCVAASLAWAGAASRDKRVRFYVQNDWDDLKPLKKRLPSPLPKEPYVVNSTDNHLTLGLVSKASWISLVKGVKQLSDGNEAFQYAHFGTAATMLTHALSQGDLK